MQSALYKTEGESLDSLIVKIFAALFILSFPIATVSSEELTLINPGFEQGSEGWSQPRLQTSGIAFTEEAAHTGKLGLRVTDLDDKTDVLLRATRLPAEPDGVYRVSFAARSVDGGRGLNVFVRFLDEEGNHIILDDEHRYHFMIESDHREWARHAFEGTAPEGTSFLEVYIRTNKRALITADLDDFQVEKISAKSADVDQK